jgi:hypothetical protein
MVDLAEIQAAYYMVAATGVLVAAAYYVMTLRTNQKNQEISLKNQKLMLKAQEQSTKAQQQNLETRQAQLFMDVFSYYHNPEFNKNFLMGLYKDWSNYDEWNRDRSDPIIGPARMSVNGYFEGIGVLVQRGLLSTEIVHEILGGGIIMWWNKHSGFIKEFRVRSGLPTYADQVEYLYDEMMKFRESGFSPSVVG